MNQNLILYYFAMFTRLSEEDALQWDSLCSACAEFVHAKLRKSVDLHKHEKRIALAVASLASYHFDLLSGSGQSGQFKIGDVSFSSSSNLDLSRKNAALDLIRDLLDSQPAFIQEVPCCFECPSCYL